MYLSSGLLYMNLRKCVFGKWNVDVIKTKSPSLSELIIQYIGRLSMKELASFSIFLLKQHVEHLQVTTDATELQLTSVQCTDWEILNDCR